MKGSYCENPLHTKVITYVIKVTIHTFIVDHYKLHKYSWSHPSIVSASFWSSTGYFGLLVANAVIFSARSSRMQTGAIWSRTSLVGAMTKCRNSRG